MKVDISFIKIDNYICFIFNFNAAFVHWSTRIKFWTWEDLIGSKTEILSKIYKQEFAKLVVRRRLIFGGDLRTMRRFLVFSTTSCLRKVFSPTSAATDLSFSSQSKHFQFQEMPFQLNQHPLFLLLGQHIVSKTELLSSQVFALKLQIP